MQIVKLNQKKGGVRYGKDEKIMVGGFDGWSGDPDGHACFCKRDSLKDAGIALWIFIIIGAVIVLLQLIPAAILFFPSSVGCL